MAINVQRYPIGVRPLLIEETARRRRVESRVVEILERAGFAEVVLPILDYADAHVDPASTYRFVDRDGELVAVRSDFTPMLARALAPTISEDTLPLRVFYRGDVIRYEPTRLGADRELFQIGAEIIGDATVDSETETLLLVREVLKELGVEPLIIVTDASIPERLGADARRALSTKRRGDSDAPIVRRILEGKASIEDLLWNESTADAARRLAAFVRIPGCVVQIDDVDPARGYYTGLRFRAYDDRSRALIAQGGRYDDLYGAFGIAAPAIGFTITLKELE